jgi:Phosphotransferase enzyme family
MVRGEPGLEGLLTAAGRTVTVDLSTSDATHDATVLAGRRAPARAELRERALGLGPDEFLVVSTHPEPADIDRFARLRRPREHLSVGPALSAVRVVRTLRGAGLVVWRVETGLRTVAHDLKVGRRWVRPGSRSIVIAGRQREPTIADEAIDQIATKLEAHLRTERRRVLSSGILMLDVADHDGRHYLLRLAAGAGAALLVRTRQAQRALLAAGACAVVRDRLAPILAAGTIRGVHYTLEPRLRGRQPRRLDEPLLAECLDFLSALSATPRVITADVATLLGEDVAVLAPHLDADRRAALERAGAVLAARLNGIAPVWVHGDFWLGNLLVEAGRLLGVLDWDASTPRGLPLTDALHLIALGDRDVRRLPHGRRCTERLWPLARAGGDTRLRRCLARTGAPDDPATLEGLAVAYWLSRVARDVRTFADRTRRPTWMAVNLVNPLANLLSAGW